MHLTTTSSQVFITSRESRLEPTMMGKLLAITTCCHEGSLQGTASFQAPGAPSGWQGPASTNLLRASCTCADTPRPRKSPPFPLFWSFYFQFVAIQPLLLYWGNHENEKQKHTLTYTTSSHKWYMSNISKLLQSHGYSEWLVMRFLGRVFARVSLSTLSPGFWNLTI